MPKDKSRKKSHQVKPASPTARTVTISKPVAPPEKPAPAPGSQTAGNLCDECAYEFGACDGKPKFASDTDPALKGTEADRVVECQTFVNVQAMPTADQGDAPGPAAAEVAASEDATGEDELIHVIPIPGATDEAKKADAVKMAADARRANLQRFQREEDLGTCPACQRALKRTAFNRDRDAVRCTNPRCRQYRSIVRNIPAK